ncbi:MAG: DUF3800 domain-containing protein [Clostridiales bacterium]|nr:DUF3800 domain-containing protein [Clostridiales bacterium]
MREKMTIEAEECRCYTECRIMTGSVGYMLVYVDESGYPIPSDTNTVSVLAAVCIDESQVRNITHAMYK